MSEHGTTGFPVEVGHQDDKTAVQASSPQWVLDSHALRSAASAGFGGPFAVGVLTPQRNAMTLAAKDLSSTYFGLYRQVFNQGFLGGFRGASRPIVAAVPQFAAIGPVYLAAENAGCPVFGAMFAASVVESICTYSSHTRNAQIQYNSAFEDPTKHIKVSPTSKLMGPGFSFHVGRNMVAMMGIRLFSPYSRDVVKQAPGGSMLSEGGLSFASDISSSIFAAMLSMPVNHMFSWASCTPALEKMSYWQRGVVTASFLVNSYKSHGVRLLTRDLCIRISYTGSLFTIYRTIERALIE